jgi:hypothetical protein
MVSRIRRRFLAPIVVCAAVVLGAAPVSAGPPDDPYYGPHSGNRGVHTLIDNQSENQGVTCVYGSDYLLDTMKIRRPLVFAYDRSNGVDREYVAWKFIVEYADSLPGNPGYNDWDNLFGSSWVKAKATDDIVAVWSPRSFNFGSNVSDHTYYRLSILIKWYYPYPSKTNVDGSALDVVQWYRWTYPSGSLNGVFHDWCYYFLI